jgi:hypothetical protein
MIAWRLISNKIYEGRMLAQRNETQFTSNPALFCEMFKKYLKCLEEEKELICEWDDLLNFDENVLTSQFNCEGIERIFDTDYRYDGDAFYIYEIETVDILV